MKFDIITLFPDYFSSPLNESLLKKAIENKIIDIKTIDLRAFSTLPNQQVDDSPYGGGAGMVLRADVLASAVKETKKSDAMVILPDPSGIKLDQNLVRKLAKKEHLIFICGRYEGIDQRFRDKYVDLEVSVGDYILNGGEVATLTMIEAISRLIPGVIGNPRSLESESFNDSGEGSLLEYPQYTRPENFENESVPKVLISGNHQEIAKWLQRESLKKTQKLRPDLFKEKN